MSLLAVGTGMTFDKAFAEASDNTLNDSTAHVVERLNCPLLGKCYYSAHSVRVALFAACDLTTSAERHGEFDQTRVAVCTIETNGRVSWNPNDKGAQELKATHQTASLVLTGPEYAKTLEAKAS